MTAFTLDLNPIVQFTSDQFDRLCAANPDIKLERTPAGELVGSGRLPVEKLEKTMSNSPLIL